MTPVLSLTPPAVIRVQGPGPAGKNDEKSTVLTEKIEDLVLQVCCSTVYYVRLSGEPRLRWEGGREGLPGGRASLLALAQLQMASPEAVALISLPSGLCCVLVTMTSVAVQVVSFFSARLHAETETGSIKKKKA